MSIFIILVLIIWFGLSGVFQANLARVLEYKKPKEAFIPFLNFKQFCKMGGRDFKFSEIFKAVAYVAELFGERKFFGYLLLAPFVNILALNHLLKNRRFFIRDEYGRQIVGEILKGMEQEVEINEIRELALSQGVEPELFEKSFLQVQRIKKMAGKVTNDEIHLLPKNFIMTLFFLGILIFLGLIFLLVRSYLPDDLSGKYKTPSKIEKSVSREKTIKAEITEETIKLDETGLKLEDSVHYSAPIDSEFVMEIDTIALDPLIKGTGLGGLITDGIIKVNDKVKILSQAKEVLTTSTVSEMSVYKRGKGKIALQVAQVGQDISMVIKDVLSDEERKQAYFLVK